MELTSTSTIISALVVVFLIAFIVLGWKRGFLRIILTTMTLVVTIIVSAFLLTPVSQFIEKNTDLDKSLYTSVERSLGWSNTKEAEGTAAAEDERESTEGRKADEEETGETETSDETKKTGGLLSLFGGNSSSADSTTSSSADSTTDKESDDLSESGISVNGLTEYEEKLFNSIKLPAFLKNMILSKDAAVKYLREGIDSFKHYVVSSISGVLLKIITYVGLVIAIFILIRILLLVSKLIGRIPVINGFNRLLGAIVGFIQGAMILWVICLIISMISQTPFGASIVDMIHQSSFLTFIYDQNLVLRIVNGILGG